MKVVVLLMKIDPAKHLDALEFIRKVKIPGPFTEEMVAELLVMYREQLGQDILDIYYKGTRNRQYPKRWEKKIEALCLGPPG